MIQIVDLIKNFTNKSQAPVNVLKNISLNLPDKGLIFVLGKSGSGKTTLLNLLGGLDFFDNGDILVNGNSTANFKQSDFDNYRNGSLGIVFQEFNLIEDLDVFQNLALPLHLQGKKIDPTVISKLLKDFNLGGFENRKVNQLSGGQKQRIAIVRSIIKNPSIILADEPTGNLDSETGKQVFEIFKKLAEEKLVVIISHDSESAYNYGQRVIELKDGKVISDLSRDKSYVSPQKDFNKKSFKKGQVITEEILLQLQQVENKNNLKNAFIPTSQVVKKDKIVHERQEMIKINSHLPLKLAFKMGVSYFKEKKFALIFFLLLSSFMFYIQSFAVAVLGCIPTLKKFQTNTEELIKDSTVSKAIDTKIILEGTLNVFKKVMSDAYSGVFYGILFLFIIVFFTIGRFVKQSIQFKRKEIGILRALGARGSDVFKIFFSEGFVISILTTIFGVLFFYLLPLKEFVIDYIVKKLVILYTDKLTLIEKYNSVSTNAQALIIKMKDNLQQFKDDINFYLNIGFVFLSIFLNTLLIVFISIFYPIYSFARKKPIEVILNK